MVDGGKCRPATIGDLPEMVRICGKSIKANMKQAGEDWSDTQVKDCLRQYIKENDAEVEVRPNGKIAWVSLG